MVSRPAPVTVRVAKLCAPAAVARDVDRPAARALLAHGFRVATLIAGPGYGKTVFAGQLARAWTGPAVWYTCDDADADPASFAAHLHAALGRIVAAPALPPASASAREVGAWAADALSAISGALVVFDDVHLLEGPTLAAAAGLIERASALGVRFVLAGRELPGGDGATLVRGVTTPVALRALCFDDEESRRYLAAARPGAPPDALAALANRIGGWPAGLALAASLPDSPPHAPPTELGSLEALYDYVATDVLAGLDPGDRRFLIETSILDELDVELCDAVSAAGASRERLSRFARCGLFIAREAGGAFVAHGLFSEALRARLGDADVTAAPILHARAADAFAARGDDVRAVEHRIAAGALDAAARALAAVAVPLHAAGRTRQLERLLDGVGAQRVAADPVLAVARGRIELAAGAWDTALATLARAESLARERGNADVVADAVRAMAPTLVARGEFERLSALLDATLALPLSAAKRTMVSITLGAFLLDRGRFDDVLDLYARIGPAVAQLDDLSLHGVVLHNTGVAHMRRGDPFPALAFYERALEVKRRHGQRTSALVTLGNQCVVLRAVGDWPAAARVADDLVREARAVGSAVMLAHALENAGAVAAAAGQVHAAAALFAEACAACDPADTLFLPDALHGGAAVALVRGDPVSAAAACARAAALLRAAGDDQRLAGVLVTRGRAVLASGDAAAALNFAREAIVAAAGPDALATATVALDVAALAALAGPLLPPTAAREAQALGTAAARTAFGLIAQRDYAFIERTRPAEVAAARRLLDAGEPDARHALDIRLLGPMTVTRGGEPVPGGAWKRRKAREIFALLVCEGGRLVPRARLIDLFWPERDADAAGDNLRVTISAMRRALGDVIRFENNGYRFDAPPGTHVDLDAFDAALRHAREAAGARDAASARRSYRAVLAAFTGDLLDGFDDERWLLTERRRIRNAVVEAARWLAADVQGDAGMRLDAVDRLLSLAPFDADAMRVRLDLLAADRRVGEARTEYERWRERYHETFGDPAPDIWQPPRLTLAPRAS